MNVAPDGPSGNKVMNDVPRWADPPLQSAAPRSDSIFPLDGFNLMCCQSGQCWASVIAATRKVSRLTDYPSVYPKRFVCFVGSVQLQAGVRCYGVHLAAAAAAAAPCNGLLLLDRTWRSLSVNRKLGGCWIQSNAGFNLESISFLMLHLPLSEYEYLDAKLDRERRKGEGRDGEGEDCMEALD